MALADQLATCYRADITTQRNLMYGRLSLTACGGTILHGSRRTATADTRIHHGTITAAEFHSQPSISGRRKLRHSGVRRQAYTKLTFSKTLFETTQSCGTWTGVQLGMSEKLNEIETQLCRIEKKPGGSAVLNEWREPKIYKSLE
eukprot:scpid43658/ scgid9855/ 